MEITELKVLGESGLTYTIALRNGVPTCSCPAFRFGGGVACKHMTFVASQFAQPVSV